MSHTYALLEVSLETYNEIKRKFIQAGFPYTDLIKPSGEIEMHGVALVKEEKR